MSEQWEGMYHRGQQSIGVWFTFLLNFIFGEVTLASHTADVSALQIKANERDVQQDAVDVARSLRDANLKFMEDLCIRFPRKLEGERNAIEVMADTNNGGGVVIAQHKGRRRRLRALHEKLDGGVAHQLLG